mmetsp:Transcript_6011/g.12600  ORF Transcript_6011/g.12600 Transcript_6011/m.12600 type:complete len:146 (+) Transcript_6011:50-487(+)
MRIRSIVVFLAASFESVYGFAKSSPPFLSATQLNSSGKTTEPRRAFISKLISASCPGVVLIFSPSNSNARESGSENAGSENASITAAFNDQASKTNSRLQSGGFKLDTKEEEDKKIKDGLASFKYDDAVSQKSSAGKGYSKKTKQ